MKVLLGLVSDCQPIGGLRRRPYLLLGWTGVLLCSLALAVVGRPRIRVLAALMLAVRSTDELTASTEVRR